VSPCSYSFSIRSWDDFVSLAQHITTVGIGVLIGLTSDLAETEPSLVSSLSSILTVEARHDAFLLLEKNQVPNPRAFDTGIHMLWAHNLALQYIVPGSCANEVPLPILPALQAVMNSSQQQSDSTIDFSWDAT
jgi:hypothetical protein